MDKYVRSKTNNVDLSNSVPKPNQRAIASCFGSDFMTAKVNNI